MGDDCNLGRFGAVRKGDVILLTEQEAAMVTRDKDKRYTRLDGGKKPKPADHLIDIDPAKMTPLQMEEANIENQKEIQRQEQLASENDPERVIQLALRSKSTHELLSMADAANRAAGREVVSSAPGVSISQLIADLSRVELAKLAKGSGESANPLQG